MNVLVNNIRSCQTVSRGNIFTFVLNMLSRAYYIKNEYNTKTIYLVLDKVSMPFIASAFIPSVNDILSNQSISYLQSFLQ